MLALSALLLSASLFCWPVLPKLQRLLAHFETEEGQREAAQMAARGREHILQTLSREAISCYWASALRHYAALYKPIFAEEVARKKAGRERAEKNKCEPEERAAVKAASRRKRVGEKPAEVQRAEAAWTVTGDALHRSLGASAGAFPEALNGEKDFYAMKIRAPTPRDRRNPTEPCVTRACCGWQSRLIVASRCATWRATCGRASRRRRGFWQPAVGTLTRGQRRRWSGRLLS